MKKLRITKFRPKFLHIIVFTILCFCLIPFLSLFAGKKIRDFCFREISYQILFDKATAGYEGDSAKSIQLYKFVNENVSVPNENFIAKDDNPFDIIIDGVGYCDQQANILITLACVGGIKGNLVFLYGFDSVSHHSVCELKINGKYRMFDPFYKLFFLTKSHNMAGINDIQKGNLMGLTDISSMPKNYFRLFEAKYPNRIFISNNFSFSKKVFRKILRTWHLVFSNFSLKPYIHAYFIFDNSNELKKKRIKKLLY